MPRRLGLVLRRLGRRGAGRRLPPEAEPVPDGPRAGRAALRRRRGHEAGAGQVSGGGGPGPTTLRSYLPSTPRAPRLSPGVPGCLPRGPPLAPAPPSFPGGPGGPSSDRPVSASRRGWRAPGRLGARTPLRPSLRPSPTHRPSRRVGSSPVPESPRRPLLEAAGPSGTVEGSAVSRGRGCTASSGKVEGSAVCRDTECTASSAVEGVGGKPGVREQLAGGTWNVSTGVVSLGISVPSGSHLVIFGLSLGR